MVLLVPVFQKIIMKQIIMDLAWHRSDLWGKKASPVIFVARGSHKTRYFDYTTKDTPRQRES